MLGRCPASKKEEKKSLKFERAEINDPYKKKKKKKKKK